MPNYASFPLRTFLKAVDSSDVKRYLERLGPTIKISSRFIPTEENIKKLLIKNSDEKSYILDPWIEMRAMGVKSFGNKIDEILKYSEINFEIDGTLAGALLKLFLDHPTVYETIKDYFLLYKRTGIQEFAVKGDKFSCTKTKKEKFEKECKRHFKEQGRGQQQKIRWYEKENEFIIVVIHGNYEQVQPYWKPGENETDVWRFRPAETDVIHYTHDRAILAIGARNRKDQGFYFGTFNQVFLGDEAANKENEKYWEFTLKPVEDGTFNFSGDGNVEKVELIEVELTKQNLGRRLWLGIKSNDVFSSMRELGLERKMKEMNMVGAKFRFNIRDGGKIRHITFSIKPPFRTTLIGKKYDTIIKNYLKENGVELH